MLMLPRIPDHREITQRAQKQVRDPGVEGEPPPPDRVQLSWAPARVWPQISLNALTDARRWSKSSKE